MFAKKRKIVIKIEGMSCEHCAKKVQTTLEKIEHVKKVKVDLSKNQAVVISREPIDFQILKEKIEALDYKVLGILGEEL